MPRLAWTELVEGYLMLFVLGYLVCYQVSLALRDEFIFLESMIFGTVMLVGMCVAARRMIGRRG